MQQEFVWLQEIEREALAQLHQQKHFELLTFAVLDAICKSGQLEERCARIREYYERYGQAVAPWITWSQPDGSVMDLTAEDTRRLIDSWERAFGRMDSPEVQAQIKARAEQLALWRQEDGRA